jgi:hypothetical protein
MIQTLRKKQGKESEITFCEKELKRNYYNGTAMYKMTEKEHSELIRIKCYRKEIYGATHTMVKIQCVPKVAVQ